MKRIIFPVVAMLGALLAGAVSGHPATERYIPIGYWASVADRETYIGKIQSQETPAHALMVEGAPGYAGYKNIMVTEKTHIYLDRSQLKLTNLDGTYADCRDGRTVEVRFAGESNEAVWIKVLITEP